MSKNKLIIGLVLIVGICGILLFVGKRPSLEEIKEKIKLTTSIRIEKMEANSNEFIFYQMIENKENVQEIMDFISSLGTDEWVATSGQNTMVSGSNRENYRLKFLDENNKTIAILQTSSSEPMKLKYKIHTYELGVRSNEVLRSIIEQINV